MIEHETLDNATPIIFTTISKNRIEDEKLLSDITIIDPIDSQEVHIYKIHIL